LAAMPSAVDRTEGIAASGGSKRPDKEPTMTTGTPSAQAPADLPFVEEVEMQGHLIDSLILPRVLDEILTLGGSYVLKDMQLGQRQEDPSRARIEVCAATAAQLHLILEKIHAHGAVSTTAEDCRAVAADLDSAFPEDFYSTTSYRTQVRLH